jgi:hypothetical protein
LNAAHGDENVVDDLIPAYLAPSSTTFSTTNISTRIRQQWLADNSLNITPPGNMPQNVPKQQSEYARIASQFEAAKKLRDAAPRPRSSSLDAAVQRRSERAFKTKHAWLMAWLGVLMFVLYADRYGSNNDQDTAFPRPLPLHQRLPPDPPRPDRQVRMRRAAHLPRRRAAGVAGRRVLAPPRLRPRARRRR